MAKKIVFNSTSSCCCIGRLGKKSGKRISDCLSYSGSGRSVYGLNRWF